MPYAPHDAAAARPPRARRLAPARGTRHLALLSAAAVLASLAFAQTGCVSGRFRDTYPKPGEAVMDSSRPYPDLTKGAVADVQVFRVKRKIRFTNTTENTIGPGTVWINQRFSRPIEAIEPGDTVQLRLIEFKDEYGEAFRAGGFFATKDPELVVLAELEPVGQDPDREFTRLIVVENRLD